MAVLLAASGARAEPARPPTLAEELGAAYESMDTVSCEIRKTTSAGGQTVRMLSRVFYRRPDHVHVDSAAPVKRRIIADGSALYYHEEGRPLGFSRPIAELDGPFLDSLRNIPATPMEHLRKLKGLPEQELPPSPDCPFRRAYQAERRFVVLSCDAQKHLTRLEFFTAPDMAVRTAEYTYEQYA